VEIEPPFAAVDLDAFDANAADLAARSAGKTLRVASKSVRCRHLLSRVLGSPGWRGVMAYTLAEAIWLVRTGITDDVLVAYPTADRAALRTVAADERLAAAITLMVDGIEQVDFIEATIGAERAPGGDGPDKGDGPDRAAPGGPDSAAPNGGRPAIRLCIDLDASWRLAGGRLHVGVRRSPVHSPAQAGALAAELARRPGYRLVGLMSYEAQVAGLGDEPAGQRARGAAIRFMQRRSMPELIARRGAAVAAVREHADLEFVNAGGTGSVAATAADPAVTEVTAGSGLYGPTLFDAYRAWRPEPSAFFALPVVRRPAAGIATVLGGGWIASGETSRSRQPTPWLPAGLALIGTEGAGEVQTPVTGAAADDLRVGDRVWFRHAKAGELCEHVNELHLVAGDRIVDTVPTYRGESRAFL
jgi:D-serine deaminase-like pyridoxal phosphate-dependent protein